MTKGSVLVRIETMVSQLATRHLTNRMDKILTVQILEPILVRIVHVGAAIEFMGQGVLNTILVTSVLEKASEHVYQ